MMGLDTTGQGKFESQSRRSDSVRKHAKKASKSSILKASTRKLAEGAQLPADQSQTKTGLDSRMKDKPKTLASSQPAKIISNIAFNSNKSTQQPKKLKKLR